jgi:2-dehydro-3-deoxyphosphogluconate aldolase/(4S)-4-hydroxy-2-oxoglutarate aldolase
MLINNFQSLVKGSPILPVLSLDNVNDAVNVSRALFAGGITCAEIVLRTPNALDCIRAVSEQVPEITVGVGTLLHEQQVKAAVKAGAKFLVSPSFTTKLAGTMQDTGLPMLPGVVSPSEITQALEMGIKELKFFPAEQYGGANTLKALGSVFGQVKFCPTGGVGPHNVQKYFALDCVFAVGGSWMVNKELIQNKQWQTITQLTQQALQLLELQEELA